MKDSQEKTLVNNKEKSYKTQDAELESVLSAHRTTIKVIGTGGAGNNTLTRMAEVGIKGIDTIAINTDAQDLLYTKADFKILIGRDITNGLGAGSDPKIGEDSALENQEEIKTILTGSDMVFITCGLGGGTGSGAAPIIADISKNIGALTIAVVTLPFTEEGVLRWNNATQGLEKLRKSTDTVIVVQNDRLLDIVPDLPLNAAFKIADEVLVNAVKGITELVTEKGLINLDFIDVKSIMIDGDTAMIGIGESDSENKAIDAVEKAITNPLLDIDITGAKKALINVVGDANMSIREARNVIVAIAEKLDPEAKIVWGAKIDEELQSTIRILLIATGLRSSHEEAKRKVTPEIEIKTESTDKRRIFDIKETKEFKLKVSNDEQGNEDRKEKKKPKKVFTEIFEEEIKGDLSILKEAVTNLDSKNPDEKILRNILKSCTSLQSSAQLFSYDKIEEFTVFVVDIFEGLVSGEIIFSANLVPLFTKIPSIIEEMVNNHKDALSHAQEFIQDATKIIENFVSDKKLNEKFKNMKSKSQELLTDKTELKMELN